MNALDQLQMLEMELALIKENINRIRDHEKKNIGTCNSLVVGEFKHRCVALKQRLTLASKITTADLNQNNFE